MSRGKLRIYLGAAPGVGKTFSMLDEGWRSRNRGTDVVIAVVVTHGRAKTEAQIRDLERVPEKVIEYRGATFSEMDVDAVIGRHPEIALVDELAHTNVPGSRNEKRWQDIEEILNAGINVIATVNIQHLESLNDVVNAITGIVQKETVPDGVVRAADQIELVDMSPEALRRRMAHGNIYAPGKVDAALGNYFRVGNLAALRELALLWVADRVEDSLHDYMTAHNIKATWETRERVVVALTGAPGGDQLIRRAIRMASRTKGGVVGVHIRNEDGLSRPPSERLGRQKALLGELGGTYHEVGGTDIAATLVGFAKSQRATQLVLGTSRRSRWTELTRGSIINSVIRLVEPIDVHVISSHEASPGPAIFPRIRVGSAKARQRIILAGIIAAVVIPLETALLVTQRRSLSTGDCLLAELAVVVVVAIVGGLWPALVSTVGAALMVDWYLTPPYGHLTVTRSSDRTALLAFVVVTGAVSYVVELAARQRIDQVRARSESTILEALAERMASADPLDEILAALRQALPTQTIALVGPEFDAPPDAAVAGDATRLEVDSEHGLVLRGEALDADQHRVLMIAAGHLGVALRLGRLGQTAATAAELSQANDLRTALLAAVSHDLRTPLASIKASATSLLQGDVRWSPDVTREFLQTIDTEADRLNNLVGNLLDMSRLQTGALHLAKRPVGLDEIVPAALAGLSSSEARVEVDVPETLARVEADPALLERAVANLIQNAIAHAPEGGAVRVEAGEIAGRVDLRIVDRGPGIPLDQREQVFQPFQRLGDAGASGGVGLGLAVARGFVQAMGGELLLEDTPGGGITMVISLKALAGGGILDGPSGEPAVHKTVTATDAVRP